MPTGTVQERLALRRAETAALVLAPTVTMLAFVFRKETPAMLQVLAVGVTGVTAYAAWQLFSGVNP